MTNLFCLQLGLMNIFPTDEERENPEIKNLFLGKKPSVDGVGTSIPIVDGLADDDFVEPPPQSVVSGFRHDYLVILNLLFLSFQ